MDSIIILSIIAANVMLSFRGFNDDFFFRKYQFHMGSIKAGEHIRMLSSGFLHADFFHLAFNMITFYFFAPVVLQTLGELSFVIIYFCSLLCGNLLTVVFYSHEYNYTAVGASGAVTGILYAAILLYPDMLIGIFGIIPMPAYVFGVLYLLYAIYGMKSRNDNIGHSAHFGGALGGYLFTLIKMPVLLQDQTLIVVVLAIPIVLLFVLVKAGKL